MAWKRAKFPIVLGILQIIFLILFGIFAKYSQSADSSDHGESATHDEEDHAENELGKYYPMFQDVHVMIFVGFGFLMTFLRRYGFSAVGLNFLISVFVIQWHILFSGFLHLHNGHIEISILSLLTADFCCATILITFGALLGKISPLQLLVVAFLEIMCFTVNEKIGISIFQSADVGGSMFVHVFGAYFGMAASRVISRADVEESSKEGSVYHSDLFSMIGTLFLWLFWPSFNSALAEGDAQHRAVINTYLALASCCCCAFFFSSLISKETKFDMVHVQNSTLAGGVAVGTCANMMLNPWGAILIGILAGCLSVVGFVFITPFLAKKLKVHDTCGVNNLHGMPGVLAGICGAVTATFASTSSYGYSLYEIFPAMVPEDNNSTLFLEIQEHLPSIEPGLGRSASTQAGYQALALVVTIGVAILTGAVTGIAIRLPVFNEPRGKELYDDEPWWETPDDFKAGEIVSNGPAHSGALQLEENAEKKV